MTSRVVDEFWKQYYILLATEMPEKTCDLEL